MVAVLKQRPSVGSDEYLCQMALARWYSWTPVGPRQTGERREARVAPIYRQGWKWNDRDLDQLLARLASQPLAKVALAYGLSENWLRVLAKRTVARRQHRAILHLRRA